MEAMEATRVVTVDSRVGALIWAGEEATVEVTSRASLRTTVEAWEDMAARDLATDQASQVVVEVGPMEEVMEEVTEEAMGVVMVEVP